MGKSSGGIRSITNAELGAVTVGNVKNYIDGAAFGYEVLGRVNRANSWTEMARADTETRMFENDRKQILRYLKKDSVAYKIVESAKAQYGLSDKQRWAVAYGLMGSNEFKKRVALDKRIAQEAQAQRKAERVARNAQKQSRPFRRFQS